MMKENLVQFIQQSILKNWDINAMTDYKGDSLKYSEVAHKILQLHAIFEVAEIKPGEKIGLLGRNSSHWGIGYLAAITYGAVIVPILPDFKPKDVHHILKHSESVFLLAADNLFEALDEKEFPLIRASVSLTNFALLSSGPNQKLKDLVNKADQLMDRKYPGGIKPATINFPTVENSRLAVISYTSGTTGNTKGVMLTHNSLIANVVYANNNMPLKPGDSIVSFLPLAHAYGCAFEFLWPFTLGCHVTFLTKVPAPAVILQAFKEVRPRLVLSVPLVIEKIYKKQILPVIHKPVMKVILKTPGLRNVIHKKIRKKLVASFGGNFHEVVIGGAALNPEVETFFKKIRFPFSIGYGMTECGPLISYANWDKAKLGSAGKIVDTMEVTIDSADPYTMQGEILVRGENVMQGYYKNESATMAAIDGEGWLHTGDLGHIDKDNYIFIKGRSKSIILGPSGQNIFPEEIEARLNNLDYILESLVVDKNHKLIALIVPDKEAMQKHQVSEEDLMKILENYRKAINKELPNFMNLSGMQLHPEEFEKTPKKSIKRFLYTIES